jgi:cytochrome c biogenesis protein CcmG/thiol:disulfide interchange protein DsbE
MTASGENRPKVSWPVFAAGFALIVPLLGTLLSGLFHDPNDLGNPLQDQDAPGFSLPRLESGEVLSLQDLQGKPSIINFWATWCQSCPMEHPVLERAAREYGPRVQFVGIAYEDKGPRLKAWLQQANRGRPAGYPTLIDVGGKAAVAYGVYGVPETYFIDKNGTIRNKKTGPFLGQAGLMELTSMVEELL